MIWIVGTGIAGCQASRQRDGSARSSPIQKGTHPVSNTDPKVPTSDQVPPVAPTRASGSSPESPRGVEEEGVDYGGDDQPDAERAPESTAERRHHRLTGTAFMLLDDTD